MKATSTILLTFLILKLNAQNNFKTKVKDEKIGVFISAGTHLSFFHVFGIGNPPLQAQIDYKACNNFFIGAGYAYDDFKFNDVFFSARNSLVRHNFRLRLFNYFGDYNKPIIGYAGGSAGISIWENKINTPKTIPFIPTVQLFIGMKTKIYDRIFNTSEIAMGAPYFIQTSFGYEF